MSNRLSPIYQAQPIYGKNHKKNQKRRDKNRNVSILEKQNQNVQNNVQQQQQLQPQIQAITNQLKNVDLQPLLQTLGTNPNAQKPQPQQQKIKANRLLPADLYPMKMFKDYNQPAKQTQLINYADSYRKLEQSLEPGFLELMEKKFQDNFPKPNEDCNVQNDSLPIMSQPVSENFVEVYIQNQSVELFRELSFNVNEVLMIMTAAVPPIEYTHYYQLAFIKKLLTSTSKEFKGKLGWLNAILSRDFYLPSQVCEILNQFGEFETLHGRVKIGNAIQVIYDLLAHIGNHPQGLPAGYIFHDAYNQQKAAYIWNSCLCKSIKKFNFAMAPNANGQLSIKVPDYKTAFTAGQDQNRTNRLVALLPQPSQALFTQFRTNAYNAVFNMYPSESLFIEIMSGQISTLITKISQIFQVATNAVPFKASKFGQNSVIAYPDGMFVKSPIPISKYSASFASIWTLTDVSVQMPQVYEAKIQSYKLKELQDTYVLQDVKSLK